MKQQITKRQIQAAARSCFVVVCSPFTIIKSGQLNADTKIEMV